LGELGWRYSVLNLPRPGIVELVVGVLRGYAGELLDRLHFVRDARFGCFDDGEYYILLLALRGVSRWV
jgi:hypothetical protein